MVTERPLFPLQRTLRELGGWSAAAQPKTPCWLETPADGAADEVRSRVSPVRRSMTDVQNSNTQRKRERDAVALRTQPLVQIHCFPGFYVLGAPKCGTSALFNVLRKHPRFVEPRGGKESHFWTVALGPVAGVGESGDRTVGNFTRANGADYARRAAPVPLSFLRMLLGPSVHR